MTRILSTILVSLICSLSASTAMADSFQLTKDGISYTCTSNEGGLGEATCATVSLRKLGYVTSDCEKVTNDAQDICAAASLEKMGYVTSDCLKLDGGGRCATTSLEKMGYITSDCLKIKNRRQDICAAESLIKSGYVTSSCLSL